MKDVYKYELKERKKRYKNLNNTCRAKTGLGFRERLRSSIRYLS